MHEMIVLTQFSFKCFSISSSVENDFPHDCALFLATYFQVFGELREHHFFWAVDTFYFVFFLHILTQFLIIDHFTLTFWAFLVFWEMFLAYDCTFIFFAFIRLVNYIIALIAFMSFNYFGVLICNYKSFHSFFKVMGEQQNENQFFFIYFLIFYFLFYILKGEKIRFGRSLSIECTMTIIDLTRSTPKNGTLAMRIRSYYFFPTHLRLVSV